MLKFPIQSEGTKKARVVFRSYTWQAGKPQLDNTQHIAQGGGTGSCQLHCPGNFTENLSSKWGEEDLITFLTAPKADGALAASTVEALRSATQGSLGGLVNTARFDAGKTSFPGQFLSFERGEPTKPQFNFELVPTNQAEANAIMQIVKYFKSKIFPVFKSGFLEFPDIWSIQFVGIKGPGFPDSGDSYNNMALVSCNVGYGGGQSALVYTDENPVAVTLQLSFQSVMHSFLKG